MLSPEEARVDHRHHHRSRNDGRRALMAPRVTDANRKWWVLATVTFSLFMVMLDTTIVNVALPAIQADLKITSQSKLEWVVNAFLLSYAVLLLPGGKLADFFGRRLFLILGIALFVASSLASGLATSETMLIVSRAVMGVGAGLMMPATHSLISANFTEREHGLAYGVWSGISTLGLALGPLAGGVLVEKVDWPWIFYVNVPLGVIAILLAVLVVRESKDASTEQGLDPIGIVVGAVGLFTLVFGIQEGATYGWTSKLILGSFIATAVALPLFILLEAKQRRPMMDLGLFRNKTFTGSNIVTALIMLTMLGILFFVSIYLQNVLGYSPIQAGATFLPLTIIFLLVSPIAGLSGDKIGFRWPVTIGMVFLAAGLYLFSRIGVHTTFWGLLPALLVGGIGIGTATAPVTAAAMSATPVDKSGVGAGVLVTFRQTGGALGVAIMGAIISGKLGDTSARSAKWATLFVDGFHDALLVATAITIGGAIVAAVLIGPIAHVLPERKGAEQFAGGLALGTIAAVPAHTAVREVVSRAVGARADISSAPVLIVNEGPLAGQRFAVESEMSLGRAGADIMLEDPEVSRRHAMVRPVDGTFEIADLGSVNGTFVNEQQITAPRRLANGDLVRLGHMSLQAEVPSPESRSAATVASRLQFPILVVKEGPLVGQRLEIGSELTIGRQDADITLPDPQISRRHAVLRPVTGGLEIADLRSVNGTFVNGERIAEARRLAAGDVVRIGRIGLEVEAVTAAPAAPAAPAPPPPAVMPTVAAQTPPPAAAPAAAPPVLVVTEGAQAGQRFPVASELSIGRADADITLDDPQISRRHAIVRPVAGAVEIKDVGSANGTFVNGERLVEPWKLVDGDIVRFGRVSLKLEAAPAEAAGRATMAPEPAAPPPAPPALVVKDGPLAGRRFPIESELSIGRVEADITLEDPQISRRHAVVRPVNGTVEIADVGSANGTFVNGERIHAAWQLADGDQIRMGAVSLEAEVPAVDPRRGGTILAPPQPHHG
jgi:EmrB/QacA subfamily drug resistance transporter